MSRNGSGTYNLPAGNPVVTGTTISSTWANNTMNDLAAALTGSVAADGQTPLTGNLNANNNKIVNVTDPTQAQDAATKTYVDAKTDGTSAGAFTTLSASGNTSLTTLSASGVATFSAGTVSAPAITTSGDTNTGIFFPAADTIAFTEGGVEAMRIASNGNVGIGTNAPIEKLDVSNGAVRIEANAPRAIYVAADGAGPLGEGAVEIVQEQNITYAAMRFLNNNYGIAVGNITCTTTATSFNSTSDYRLKENIAPMTGALDKVARLKPVTYTWKSNGEAAQGFIAHELQEVVPDAVTGKKDAVDANGKPIYQGVDTSFLVATLTAAIQEQQAIINDLKARIETLEAK